MRFINFLAWYEYGYVLKMVAFVYVVCFFLLGFYNFNTIPKEEFLIKEYILIISTSEIITTRFSPTVPLVHYKLFGLVFLPETLFQCPIIQYSFFYACIRTTHTHPSSCSNAEYLLARH